MKIASLIFIPCTLFAMQQQPRTKADCFFAYTQFKASIHACKQMKSEMYDFKCPHLIPDIDARHECILRRFENFSKECKKEAHH